MNKLIKNYFFNILYQLFVLLAPLITAPYLARVLGSDALGQASYVSTVAGLFATIGMMGIQDYSIREIAFVRNNPSRLEKTFWEIFILRLSLGTLTAIIFLIYSFFSKYPMLMGIFILYVIAAFLDPCWFYIGLEDMGKSVARNLFAKIVTVFGIFIFVKTIDDVWKYVLLLSLSTFFASILAIPYLIKYIHNPPSRILLHNILYHLRSSLPLFVPQISSSIYMSFGKILLEHSVSSAAVAYYDQAYKFVQIPLTFITVLSTVMMPRLASVFSSGDTDAAKKYLIVSIRFSLMIAFPMMLGIICIAPGLIPWYLGDDFLPVVHVIWSLAPLIIMSSLLGISSSQYFVATNQTKVLAVSHVCGVLVNIVMCFVFIHIFSSVGPGFALVITYGVMLVMQYYTMVKKNNIFRELVYSVKYFILAFPMAFLVSILGRCMHPCWKTSLIQIIVGVLTYTIMLFLSQDKLLLKLISKVRNI